ncbi:type I polyketide synthase [Streptomyces sulphureus]|uniref:type I polyketide synthase n=1 Tax=Streptomyces sulphureus TaxID=47758 RepID=UPI00037CDFFA|nr:type I polyketide synthase [Streptomyces sulphureus]
MTSMSQRLAELTDGRRGELAARLAGTAGTVASEPIAVIGLGCRFPGGVTTPEDFWSALLEARDLVGETSRGGGRANGRTGALAEPRLAHGGLLDDPWGLDNEFFAVSPREAAAMDPQQRMLLEVAWETAEHAGVPVPGLHGSRSGVFLGLYYNEHLQAGLAEPESVDAYTITGGLHSVAAGRLSYTMGLRGPCIALDTACSSSLAAVHLACQSLRLRESDLAFAGGANLILGPELSLSLHRYGLLAEDGRCKTFDASANGIVRTEGCAMVLLKRLTDALDDGDRVLAVLRGSAVNQDGKSNGLTAPSGTAQRELLADVVARTGTAPEDVGFIEAHGTGTELGDPIEVEAIASAYGRGDKGGLALGAVKTNLGHTEAAAGVTALLKAVLCVRHGVVPPNLHFRQPNPKMELAGTRLFVPTAVTEWPVAGGPRLAAASSFGMGGTNAHAIVEESPVPEPGTRPELPRAARVFVLTGATEQAARENAGRLARRLESDPPELADVAHTLAHRRAHAKHRITAVADGPQELAERLDAAARGEAATLTAHTAVTPSAADGAVWVFSGHGSQWTGMGRELLDEPEFAAVIDALAPVYEEEAGIRLRADLAEADLDALPADRVQPLIHAVQVGLAETLRAHGAAPAAVLGHSMGEIAAAVAAGALPRETAARIVLRRSRLLAEVAGQGAMAVVTLPEPEAVERWHDVEVDVAIRAAHDSVVLSGSPAAVDAVVAECESEGIPVRRVASDVAFHGRQMIGLDDRLAASVSDLTALTPRVPVYSTVHEDPRRTPAYDAAYWGANLRGTVRFADAVDAALEDGHRVFLELAPHAVLTRSVTHIARQRDVSDAVAVACSRRGTNATATLRSALATLYGAGAPVDLSALVPDGRLTDLPRYAWQHNHHGMPDADRKSEPEHVREEWTHRLVWSPAPPVRPERPAESAGTPGAQGTRWLLVGDDPSGVAAALAERLEAAGARCRRVVSVDAALADDAPLAEIDRVVHLGGLALPGAPDGDPAPVHEETIRLLRLVRVLADRDPTPRLHLVTRLAQAVDGRSEVRPGGAALWGLGSTLALDYPATWGGAVDVDADDPRAAAELVVDELVESRPDAAGHEPEVAFRGGERYVPRLEKDRVPRSDLRLDPDGCHLVVGASGLLGPRLARHLVALGARHLVLTSRKGPSPELVATLRESGARVTAVAADVADPGAMDALFARFGADLPELHGVYHAAMTNDFTETDALTPAGVTDMLRPKVDGTVLLHRLSLSQPVRHFVLFSSTTALLGSRGLAHYAAANRFLDAFAHAREARELPCRVVNWGAFGSWTDTASYGHLMKESGMRGLDDDEAIRLLGHIMADARVQRVVADVDWQRLAAAYRSRTAMPLLDPLTGSDMAGTGAGGETGEEPGAARASVEAAPRARRRTLVRDHVRRTVAEVMGFADPRQLPLRVGFFEIGLDSLMSVQAQQRLATAFDCDLAPAAVFNHPTVEALTDHVLALLAPSDQEATAPPPTASHAPDRGTDLSEDELAHRLTEKLRSLS